MIIRCDKGIKMVLLKLLGGKFFRGRLFARGRLEVEEETYLDLKPGLTSPRSGSPARFIYAAGW